MGHPDPGDGPRDDLQLGLRAAGARLDQLEEAELARVSSSSASGSADGDPVALEGSGEDDPPPVVLHERNGSPIGERHLVAHLRVALGVAEDQHAAHDPES